MTILPVLRTREIEIGNETGAASERLEYGVASEFLEWLHYN